MIFFKRCFLRHFYSVLSPFFYYQILELNRTIHLCVRRCFYFLYKIRTLINSISRKIAKSESGLYVISGRQQPIIVPPCVYPLAIGWQLTPALLFSTKLKGTVPTVIIILIPTSWLETPSKQYLITVNNKGLLVRSSCRLCSPFWTEQASGHLPFIFMAFCFWVCQAWAEGSEASELMPSARVSLLLVAPDVQHILEYICILSNFITVFG